MKPDDAEFWDGPGKIVGTIKMMAAAATNIAPELRREPQGGGCEPQRPDTDNAGREEAAPSRPRTPYPVEHPGISDQPGSEPDYLPGTPAEDLPKM